MSTERSDREIIDAATPGPWESDGSEISTSLYGRNDGGRYSGWIGETCRPGDPEGSDADALFIAAARTRWPAALDRVSQLEEALRDAIAVLRRFTRCPLYAHEGDTRRRRIDCADDQCQNPACTSWVECSHPAHAARELLAALTLLDAQAQPDEKGTT